jgi:hypothetical protein
MLRHRSRIKYVLTLLLGVTLLAVNGPVVVSFAERVIHNYEINTTGYKKKYGHWSILPVASKYRINAVHAALLYTGKVLIVAGSGNNQGNFNAGRFESVVWNPANNTFKKIHTPNDMFCGGQEFLPDGKLLIAGGTARYEVLASKVKHAAGVMFVQNTSLISRPFKLAAGTRFRAPDGAIYVSTVSVTIPPATKLNGANGAVTVVPSGTETWVRALSKGKRWIVSKATRFTILGTHPVGTASLYGQTTAINMDQQDFWGSNKSFIFDPATERYERVSNLNLARWYPTLVGLANGDVLAVSGLNQFGQIINGQTEEYTPATKMWTPTPNLTRVFPTYPALFLMPDGNLFFSGSNAGYGSSTIGRTPGIWNLNTNGFTDIPGLKNLNETETSGSLLLPPAQKQRYMIIGGGGIGQSLASTARTAIVDLNQPRPHWTAGPSLPEPTRYPDAVITPDNTVIITGGSRYYRGEFNSDTLTCHLYIPATNRLTPLASPTVGRDYHSEALLLPDGRIVTLGGNPLFGDKNDTTPGYFQTAIEIYSPPYLYHGSRPQITGGPRQLLRGQAGAYTTSNSKDVSGARLLAPSAFTHVTNVNQRSIEVSVVRRGPHTIVITVPTGAGLVPTQWYMLFVTNSAGTPSVGYWVHVGGPTRLLTPVKKGATGGAPTAAAQAAPARTAAQVRHLTAQARRADGVAGRRGRQARVKTRAARRNHLREPW